MSTYPRKHIGISMSSAVVVLMSINIVAYILQMVVPGFTELFLLQSSKVLVEPWRLITSMFLHSLRSPWHIVLNMLWLFFFGSLLESKIGQSRFMIIYFTSGLLASVGAAVFYPAALGASGAIMGIVGTTIILMPHKVIYLNFVPVPLWLAGVAFAAMDALGIFIPDGTGNIAHLIGLGIGLLYGVYLKTKKVKAIKMIKRKNHLDADDMKEYMKSGRI